jgi:hypothetical protein
MADGGFGRDDSAGSGETSKLIRKIRVLQVLKGPFVKSSPIWFILSIQPMLFEDDACVRVITHQAMIAFLHI